MSTPSCRYEFLRARECHTGPSRHLRPRDRVAAGRTHQGAKKTMDDRIRFAVHYGDVVTACFCSQLCGMLWLKENAIALPHAELVTGEIRVPGACVHCCWCSEAVAVPYGVCRLHGPSAHCPDFSALTATVVLRVVQSLRRHTGAPLPDAAWPYLIDLAEMLWDAGHWPSGELLYSGMLTCENEWADSP